MFPYQTNRQDSGRWLPAQAWIAFALLMILLGLSFAR